MKPKNFPAQKLRRQLEAKIRLKQYRELTDGEWSEIDAARAIRTKKRRSA